MPSELNLDYSLLAPEFGLAGLAALIVALDLFVPRFRKEWLPYVTAAGLLAILGLSLGWVNKESDFAGLLFIDNYTTFFRVFFIATTAAVALASAHFVQASLQNPGEFYGLLVLSTIGAIYMAAARELLTAYIALELLSFSLYVLVSFAKFDSRSNEGGMKYMLLGAFASALFLYGLSMIYGSAGSTFYADIAAAYAGGTDGFELGLLMGLVLVLAGLGFKVAAVPFHMWTPDAYEGAPLPITAYLSATAKAATFALLLRLFAGPLLPLIDDWQWMMATIAVATMLGGNLIALQQTNIKRLLAYSSIGQVGYMLMAITTISDASASALLVHVAGYLFTNLAVFSAVIAFHNRTGHEEISEFRGLAETNPYLAMVLTAGMFSLAGMPLVAGFVTKFILFQAAAQEGFLWLAAVAVIASTISLYYYLIVIRNMYLREPAEGESERWRLSPAGYAATGLLSLGVLVIGLYPAQLFYVADRAVAVLALG